MITNSRLFVCHLVIDIDPECKTGKIKDFSKSININRLEALSNTSFSTSLVYAPVKLYVFIY